MKRSAKVLLVLVAVISFAVALYYPIQYWLRVRSNNSEMTELKAMRQSVIDLGGLPTAEPLRLRATEEATPTANATPAPTDIPILATPEPTIQPGVMSDTHVGVKDEIMDYILNYAMITPTPRPTSTPRPELTPAPTVDRDVRYGPLAYSMKEKVELDEGRILPELREIYKLNNDLVGWLTIPDSNVDYPVVQSEDNDFYLTHDFYGEENNNGQIILDNRCDPYTPSYNLVISGHNMLNGTMFARILYYSSSNFWKYHKVVEFDTLMERKRYVVFAAFYSADYDEDEEGFRYSADIQYRQDAEQWLKDIEENRIYNTGIDAEFGDEFITLTTCTTQNRQDGRFVVVCRRIREGENY